MQNLAEMKQQQSQQRTQQPAGNALAAKPKTIFDYLSGDPKMAKAVAAVAGTYFTPDRFLRLAVNAIKKAPLLAQCDTQTVLGAFMTSAALGLEPNTVLQQAFLIPYKKRQKQGNEWVDVYECNFQIGARGFVTLAHRSPHIATLDAEAIHRGDHFKHMKGSRSFLEFEKALADRGELIGAFCFTKMADGNEHATVLPLDEILKIRGRSETYSALERKLVEASSEADRIKAQKKLDETPWVMWADDMAAKSAIKKHSKQMPLSPGDAMSVAAQLDGDDGRTIDMASMADADTVRTVMKEGVDGLDTGGVSSEAFGATARAMAALDDDPSPTLQQAMPARAADVIDATNVVEHPAAHRQQQLDERGPVEKLKHRFLTLTDVDMLDAEADLINDTTTDPGERADLTNAYTARRAALIEAQAPATVTETKAPATRRQRTGMSID